MRGFYHRRACTQDGFNSLHFQVPETLDKVFIHLLPESRMIVRLANACILHVSFLCQSVSGFSRLFWRLSLTFFQVIKLIQDKYNIGKLLETPTNHKDRNKWRFLANRISKMMPIRRGSFLKRKKQMCAQNSRYQSLS